MQPPMQPPRTNERTGQSPRTQPEANAGDRRFENDDERLRSFATALDALRAEVEAQLGSEDVEHIERIARLSRNAEIIGRGLIHLSFDPFTFGLGVGALAGHNVRHHQYTNIAGRDPDLDFGGLRLSERIPHRALHRLQPLSNFVSWLGFATAINLHVTGLLDVYLGKSQPPVLPDHSWQSVRDAHVAFLRKFVPCYAREQVLFPLLAAPFFWKVSLGNWLSDVGRDVWAASIIYCGHVGARDYAKGTRAGGRPGWYVMQVEAAHDVELPLVASVQCGGLDKQIEHHLFSRLPPNRLRAIAPRVHAICEEHDVPYRVARWSNRVRDVTIRLRNLSRPAAAADS